MRMVCSMGEYVSDFSVGISWMDSARYLNELGAYLVNIYVYCLVEFASLDSSVVQGL
jgi:hypothetical protein